MKHKLTGLSQRYVATLQKFLRHGPQAGLRPALALGRSAAELGFETLDLARMHEEALEILELSNRNNGTAQQVEWAQIFFSEAISPIVEKHRVARQGRIDLNRLNATLSRRTVELAMTNRQLRRGIFRRRGVEAALKKSDQYYARLLKDSLQLQSGLRQLTHKVLAAQEEERKKISHELQDEIAQTLLGINVRLVSLRQEARHNNKGLKKEIDSTQQLVVKSTKSVQRAARNYARL